jgi:hypothetical protein
MDSQLSDGGREYNFGLRCSGYCEKKKEKRVMRASH